MFTFVCELSWLCLYSVCCMSKLCSLSALQLHEKAFYAMHCCFATTEWKNKADIMTAAFPCGSA